MIYADLCQYWHDMATYPDYWQYSCEIRHFSQEYCEKYSAAVAIRRAFERDFAPRSAIDDVAAGSRCYTKHSCKVVLYRSDVN